MERRAYVAYAQERGLSERRACQLLDLARSTMRYTAQPDRDEVLVSELQQIKEQNPRFGIRRAHALLHAAGQTINRKRVARVWHNQGMQVSQRRKKRKLKTGNKVPLQAERPNHVWCYDFQEDAVISGRKIRLLNVLDEFTREWLSVVVGASLTSQHVLATLQKLFLTRGIPAFVRSDNGSEFIAAEVQAGLRTNGSAPYFIEPGSPWQNGYQESFPGKLRDEFLNRETFASLKEAQVRLDKQRHWYNQERPHSSLKYQAPQTYRLAWEQSQLEQSQLEQNQ